MFILHITKRSAYYFDKNRLLCVKPRDVVFKHSFSTFADNIFIFAKWQFPTSQT